MSYTATYDVSHKVKADGGSHAKNYLRHIAREADERAGFDFPQTNENIDLERTKRLNATFVNDGAGGYRLPVVTHDDKGRARPPSAEFEDYLATRLATVKTKPRKGAVVMRPLILQLDSEWFDEHNPDWRRNGLNADARHFASSQIVWAEREFGKENIVGYSVHLDETNPQIHVIITPVTNDGRLSQKDFFKGPSDLKRQHKEYRQHLADAGFDVDFTVSTRSKEHLNSSEFAREAERVKEAAAAVRTRETNASVRERKIAQEEAHLPTLRANARAKGREEGLQEATAARLEAEEATRRAKSAERTAQVEQARLAALIANRPIFPSREELEKQVQDQQPKLVTRFLAGIKAPNGETLSEHYQHFCKSQFAKSVDYQRKAYEDWYAEASAETVGDVKQQHADRVANILVDDTSRQDRRDLDRELGG